MKDASEVEKASFLKSADNQPKNEDPSAVKAVEKEYDLMNNNKKGPDKGRHFHFLEICDFLIVTTVILVNVVAFWRGLFGIFSHFRDFYLLFFIYLFGCLIHFQFAVSRTAYKKYLKKKSILESLLRRTYTYVFGSASVMQWAGLWFILDEMSGLEVNPPLVYSVVCSGILMCIRVYRNVLAPPFLCCTDRLDQFFDFQTAFKTALSKKGSSDTSLYVLDSFFSVFVIGSLVVFVWRGVWCLMDIFLYPENDKYSAFGSLAIGYGIAVIIFSIKPPMINLSEKTKGFWKVVILDIYVLVAFIGTINLWRGIWNLLNIYFLPDSPVLSCWLSHLGSFAVLVLMNCSNSVLVRGVYIDGEGDTCGVFPISYLRLIFEKRLKKKSEINEKNHKINSLTNVCGEDIEKGQRETHSETINGAVQNSSDEPKP